MRIKYSKCQIFFYDDQETTNVFDFKDLVATAVTNSEKKKNIEFIKISGFDENNKKISIRLDFGSMMLAGEELNNTQSKENLKIDRLFGEILIQMGCITKKQLDECLDLQSESDYGKKLGEILIEKGYLKPSEVLDVISQQVGENYLKKQFRFEK